MKKFPVFLALLIAFFAFSPAVLAYFPPSDAHFANRTGDSHDSNSIEGWIVKMDIQTSRLFIMDASGVEKQILLKPGIISDFRIKDKVRIKAWPGTREANTIEKIKS